MALQSGGQAAYEAEQKGATPSQQFAKGLTSGVIEAATEKIPLEGLKILARGGKTGIKTLFKNLLKQGATEAVEESIAYLANNVAGKAILGELEDDFDLKQLGYSALLGGISGGVMGGGASAIGAISNQAQNTPNLPPKTSVQPTTQQSNVNLPPIQQNGVQPLRPLPRMNTETPQPRPFTPESVQKWKEETGQVPRNSGTLPPMPTKRNIGTLPPLRADATQQQTSKFFNSTQEAELLTPETKGVIANSKDSFTYNGITNAETYEKALNVVRLNPDMATKGFFTKQDRKSVV